MTELPFGPGALWVVALYLCGLLIIGAMAYRSRREESLGDFYLGGRSMGLVVLFLTLYATQYSGNTLFGFSGAAYRQGLGFLVCVPFMTAIVLAYLLLAPKLYKQSRAHAFITPGDYIEQRFQSPALRIAVTLIMIYVLCNFTLAQMKTLGTAFEGISQGRVPMWVGVVGLAFIMLVYESLGGMRSVAWTDVMQGGILMVGFALLLFMAFGHLGDLPSAIRTLAESPETRPKIMPPDTEGVRTWLSFILLVGLGGAIYPQAIQRLYAAKNSDTLRRSLALMGFMPLITALIAVTVGVLMAAHRPDLGGGLSSVTVPSETALTQLCFEVMQASSFGYWLVVILFAAILAAVMSTADSALLSISSMVTRDFYSRFIQPDASQQQLTRLGRWVTVVMMIPIVWLALTYEGTLIQLLKIKFDLLIQCVPAFFLGVHWRNLKSSAVLTGLIAGVAVALGLIWAGYSTFWGFHSGLWGLALNLLVCTSGPYILKISNIPG